MNVRLVLFGSAMSAVLYAEPETVHAQLFVTNSGNNNVFGKTVGEYAASGATVNASLITGLSRPFGIAVSGQHLFVANYSTGTIGEYTTSGATVNASLITGLGGPFGIALLGHHLFITNFNSGVGGGDTISEYTTSGALVNGALVSGLTEPTGIAVSGRDLFVANPTAMTFGPDGALYVSNVGFGPPPNGIGQVLRITVP